MAKLENFSQLIPVARIGWLTRRNLARFNANYGDEKSLKSLTLKMANHPDGWAQSTHGTIDAEKASDEEKAEMLRERTEHYESLKAQSAGNPALLLNKAVFEELYMSNGKIIAPDIVGIDGHRRARVFFDAMVMRKGMVPPLPVSQFIPAIVHESLTPAQRIRIQVEGNELEADGFLPMDIHQKLKAAITMVDLGAIQNDLRKTFKDGTGQKLWGVITLNGHFPELKIIDRMFQAPDSKGYIHLPGVKFSDLPKMNERADKVALEKVNKDRKLRGESEFLPCTAEEVERYFSDPSSRTEPAKMMGRPNVESLTKSSNRLIGQVAGAILNATPQSMQHLIDYADGFNAHLTLNERGHGNLVGKLLVKLAQKEDAAAVIELLNQFVEVAG